MYIQFLILFLFSIRLGECADACSSSLFVKELNIPESKKIDGLSFPLVLTPQNPNSTIDDQLDYLREEHEDLLELAKTHGAVLLRGWKGEHTAEHFSKIMSIIEDEPHFDMSCSAGPRVEVSKGVFTANDAPPEDTIPFHHEMAQCDHPPRIVCFFCKDAPTDGGSTSLILSHTVVQFLRDNHPEVVDKLVRLGVRYVRRQAPETDNSSALGKSWKLNFLAETKEEAEEQMRLANTTWEWLENDYLHTITRVMPAIPVESSSSKEGEVAYCAKKGIFYCSGNDA